MTCKVDTSSNVTISEEEAALYDRQIRLWGVEAQNRLKCSRIVLLGMNALSSEVAKNLVLAGIASLFIIDDDIVSEEDVSSNFLICSDSVGEIKSVASVQRLQSLNPMVKVQAITSVSYNETISNSQDYDVVILASSPMKDDIVRWESVAVTLARVSKESSSPLIIFLSSIHLFGVVFIDLSLHHFIAEEVVLKKRPSGTPGFDSKSADRTETVLVKKHQHYPSFMVCSDLKTVLSNPNLSPMRLPKGFLIMQTLRQINFEHLPLSLELLSSTWSRVAASAGIDVNLLTSDDLLCCCGPPVPSVNAVLGGITAQEVVRAVTGKGAPQGNWYFFNGSECSVTVDWITN